MNHKIGKNAKPKGYLFRWGFRREQRTLWREECRKKRQIPRDVAEVFRGVYLLGKPQEIIEDAVRLFCKIQRVKFNKRLVARALLIWLSYTMQDRVKNGLTIEQNYANVPPL